MDTACRKRFLKGRSHACEPLSLRSFVTWTGVWSRCECRRVHEEGAWFFIPTDRPAKPLIAVAVYVCRTAVPRMLIVGWILRPSTESRLRLFCLEHSLFGSGGHGSLIAGPGVVVGVCLGTSCTETLFYRVVGSPVHLPFSVRVAHARQWLHARRS